MTGTKSPNSKHADAFVDTSQRDGTGLNFNSHASHFQKVVKLLTKDSTNCGDLSPGLRKTPDRPAPKQTNNGDLLQQSLHNRKSFLSENSGESSFELIENRKGATDESRNLAAAKTQTQLKHFHFLSSLLCCLLSMAVPVYSSCDPLVAVLLVICSLSSFVCSACNFKEEIHQLKSAVGYFKIEWKRCLISVVILSCVLTGSVQNILYAVFRSGDLLVSNYLLKGPNLRPVYVIASETILFLLNDLYLNRSEPNKGVSLMSFEMDFSLEKLISVGSSLLVPIATRLFFLDKSNKSLQPGSFSCLAPPTDPTANLLNYLKVYRYLGGEPDFWLDRTLMDLDPVKKPQSSDSIPSTITPRPSNKSLPEDVQSVSPILQLGEGNQDFTNFRVVLQNTICFETSEFLIEPLDSDLGEEQRASFGALWDSVHSTIRSEIGARSEVLLEEIWTELQQIFLARTVKLTISNVVYVEQKETDKMSKTSQPKILCSFLLVCLGSESLEDSSLFVRIQPTRILIRPFPQLNEDVFNRDPVCKEGSPSNSLANPKVLKDIDSQADEIKEDSSGPSDRKSLSSEEKQSRSPMQVSIFGNNHVPLVVHEMRSPLSCILGNLELINYELKEHEIYELISPLLQTSIASSVMLETLVNDILDADRISKGIFQMDSMRMNLKETIQECIDTMGMAAKARGNKIEFDYEGPVTITSDRVRLKQILLNFLSNSVKFTSKGKIQVSVQDKEDTKRIEIQDNGKGISPENLRNLFQKYHSDRRHTDNTNGLGFGLYICKSIISRLGPKDKIDVNSEVGKGTSFSFEIYKNTPSKSTDISKKSSPRDLNEPTGMLSDRRANLKSRSSSDEFTIFNLNNQFALNSKRLIQCKMKWGIATLDSEKTPKIKASGEPSQVKNFTNLLESLAPKRASGSSSQSVSKQVSLTKIPADQPLAFLLANEAKEVALKVLIVDDDPFILELLKDFFAIVANQLQIEVLKDSSDSVAGAIDKFRHFAYDLVIVDYNLPDGTGTDIVLNFSKQIRENRADSQPPLFALSTGLGKDDPELESCKSLFFEILTKPISLEKFRSLLQDVITVKHKAKNINPEERMAGPEKLL